jgi:glucan 1,4-alpha-glucosidase
MGMPRRRCAAVVVAAVVTALAVPLLPAVATGTAAATDAPGAPGAGATWTTGDKEGLGTSTTASSKVWYTLTGGALSEVYYPSGITPNVRELQFAVTDGSTFAQRETDSTTTRTVAQTDQQSLTYRQTTTDQQGRWRLTKTYVTDPARPTVLIHVRFQTLVGGPYQLYALYDPSLAGDSGNDTGSTAGSALVASDTHLAGAPVASALAASPAFAQTSTGYVGASDGWGDLSVHDSLTATYPQAGPGNIAQVGQVAAASGASTSLDLALSFGASTDDALASAKASLTQPFATVRTAYETGWHNYLRHLKKAPTLSTALTNQYWTSVMTLKAHEDKTFPGAFIASLTIPWGQSVDAGGASGAGNGYHFVWARDEYEQVSSLLAAGDNLAADDAVTWLFTRQQQDDGHFPQNSKVDGAPDQTNVQLDETAYPLILAWQVKRFDRTFYTEHIAPAADYLVSHGPATPQERWEETGGYSPTTIATEIAGLTSAADIARRAGDTAGATIYQATADSWQRRVEAWTYTTSGNLSDGSYYVRIDANGTPDDGAVRTYANGAGTHAENSVVDAGFLELTRLGVKAPNDPYVKHSLIAVDQSIKVETPSGAMWHRYTFDGYGEKADGSPWDGTGIGRPWPLLSGERGEYVLANGGNALPYLRTMARSANAGRMIPEQAWDQPDPTSFGHVFGKGTGSAAPLAWAMGQYVRLAQGIAAGTTVETPSVVADRYASGRTRQAPELTVTSPADLSTATSRTIHVTGATSAKRLYLSVNGAKQRVPVRGGAFDVEITLPSINNQLVLAAIGANGGTAQVVRTAVAFGTHVGGLTDPAGDDNGPGTYVYPTNPVYIPGIFDLTGTDVYMDGSDVRFVTTIAGPVTNDFGGDQISHQRINIYVGDGTGSAVGALPGTNMDTTSPWTAVVVADGRFDSAGVFGPNGSKIGDVTLTAIPATHQIVATVPRTALGGIDLASASYGVAMFGNAEAGEGIGNVRPVYDLSFWQDPGPGLDFITQFRFGGGAGVFDDTPGHDSDIRDPNAIDIVVGPGQTQTAVMDWRAASPVALPMVPLSAG